jgi:hypothetical protein
MPRFFFDVVDGSEVTSDQEGVEFADLEAARTEAVQGARDLVAHGIMRNEDVSGQSFSIRDEKGQTVALVPFRDTLPGTLRR